MKKPDWLFLVLLGLSLCLLYAGGVGGPLLFDSKVALTNNAQLHLDPTELNQWRAAVGSSSSGPSGRPVTMFSFSLNYALSNGADVGAIKWTNVLLHLVTAALAYALLLTLLQRAPVFGQVDKPRAIAMTAVALWALHPLQVSTVLYAVQRMEMLSALFILAGLLFWIYRRGCWLERMPTAAELSRTLAGLFIFLLLAIFSKEDGVLLLPLLLVTELLLFRARLGGVQRSAVLHFCLFGLLLPFTLALIVLAWPPDWLLQSYAGRDFSLYERVLTQFRVLWVYLGWIFWPVLDSYGLHHDSFELSRSLLNPVTTLWAVAAWLICLGLAIWRWKAWPLYAFCVLWYLLAHSVESSLVPLEMAYEHRNYLPSLAPAMGVATLLWQWIPALERGHRLGIALLILALLSLQTWQRSNLWGDEERMSAAHLRQHPQSVRSAYHYANTQLRLAEKAEDAEEHRQRLVKARAYYEYMHQLDPANLPALVTLLYIDSRYFRNGEATGWVKKLLDLPVDLSIRSADRNAMNLLLQCMLHQWCAMHAGQFETFLDYMQRQDPGEPLYRSVLAVYVGESLKDYSQAIALHEAVLQEHPGYLPALLGLVRWHQQSGSQGQALESLRRILQQDTSAASVQRVKSILAPVD